MKVINISIFLFLVIVSCQKPSSSSEAKDSNQIDSLKNELALIQRQKKLDEMEQLLKAQFSQRKYYHRIGELNNSRSSVIQLVIKEITQEDVSILLKDEYCETWTGRLVFNMTDKSFKGELNSDIGVVPIKMTSLPSGFKIIALANNPIFGHVNDISCDFTGTYVKEDQFAYDEGHYEPPVNSFYTDLTLDEHSDFRGLLSCKIVTNLALNNNSKASAYRNIKVVIQYYSSSGILGQEYRTIDNLQAFGNKQIVVTSNGRYCNCKRVEAHILSAE